MEQFYQLLIHGKVQREDGPCIDVTDFTFTESEGAKVPYAYAADCILKPAVTICSLYGTNLKFEKSAKTFIGYFGHRVRNRFWLPKRSLSEIYRVIRVYPWPNQPFISGDVQLSNNDQNLKLTVSGFCGFTNFGGENFDGKLGREKIMMDRNRQRLPERIVFKLP